MSGAKEILIAVAVVRKAYKAGQSEKHNSLKRYR